MTIVNQIEKNKEEIEQQVSSEQYRYGEIFISNFVRDKLLNHKAHFDLPNVHRVLEMLEVFCNIFEVDLKEAKNKLEIEARLYYSTDSLVRKVRVTNTNKKKELEKLLKEADTKEAKVIQLEPSITLDEDGLPATTADWDLLSEDEFKKYKQLKEDLINKKVEEDYAIKLEEDFKERMKYCLTDDVSKGTPLAEMPTLKDKDKSLHEYEVMFSISSNYKLLKETKIFKIYEQKVPGEKDRKVYYYVNLVKDRVYKSHSPKLSFDIIWGADNLPF